MNNKFITPILFLFGLASWPARGLACQGTVPWHPQNDPNSINEFNLIKK